MKRLAVLLIPFMILAFVACEGGKKASVTPDAGDTAGGDIPEVEIGEPAIQPPEDEPETEDEPIIEPKITPFWTMINLPRLAEDEGRRIIDIAIDDSIYVGSVIGKPGFRGFISPEVLSIDSDRKVKEESFPDALKKIQSLAHNKKVKLAISGCYGKNNLLIVSGEKVTEIPDDTACRDSIIAAPQGAFAVIEGKGLYICDQEQCESFSGLQVKLHPVLAFDNNREILFLLKMGNQQNLHQLLACKVNLRSASPIAEDGCETVADIEEECSDNCMMQMAYVELSNRGYVFVAFDNKLVAVEYKKGTDGVSDYKLPSEFDTFSMASSGQALFVGGNVEKKAIIYIVESIGKADELASLPANGRIILVRTAKIDAKGLLLVAIEPDEAITGQGDLLYEHQLEE